MKIKPDLTYDETYEIALEGFTYLYPLVLMEVTRRQQTNTLHVDLEHNRGPANAFVHRPSFPGLDDRGVVRPNFDTLYSSAWLDLEVEPMVITIPASNGRYYLLPMLDMWTDVFASVGVRTTGSEARHVVVVPPGFREPLPPDLERERIAAPTPRVLIIGRTKCDGTDADYEAVHAFQAGLQIIPLSAYPQYLEGATIPPPVGRLDASVPEGDPLHVVDVMSAEEFFRDASNLMIRHPAHFNDHPILARLYRAHFEPGDFELTDLPQEMQDAYKTATEDAHAQMVDMQASIAPVRNGWTFPVDGMGAYGTSYRRRAIIGLIGLGANLPEDAIYPTAYVDSNGDALDSNYQYILEFPDGKQPPVNGFWSVTMYDDLGYQVDNPIHRYVIRDRDQLTLGDDNLLTLYIQRDEPEIEEHRPNWLPAPQTSTFNLTMRLYYPQATALGGDWEPPAVKKV